MKWSIAFEVLGSEFSRVDPAMAAKMARMSHLKGPQAALESALERLAALSSESAYEKEFETKFSKTADALNLDMMAFQISNLSQFLRRNQCLSMCLPTHMGKSAP